MEGIQLLYCIYQSDDYFIKNIFDSELYELDIIFDTFFNIYHNMRPTNIVKTNYLYAKLLKDAENLLTIFLKRHQKIYNQFVKRNPETGEEYLEF